MTKNDFYDALIRARKAPGEYIYVGGWKVWQQTEPDTAAITFNMSTTVVSRVRFDEEMAVDHPDKVDEHLEAWAEALETMSDKLEEITEPIEPFYGETNQEKNGEAGGE